MDNWDDMGRFGPWEADVKRSWPSWNFRISYIKVIESQFMKKMRSHVHEIVMSCHTCMLLRCQIVA